MKNAIKKIISHAKIVCKYANIATIKSYAISPDIKLEKGTLITRRVSIAKSVSIGKYTYINSNYNWTTIESNTVIGKYSSIGPGAAIGYGNHNYKYLSTHPFLYNSRYGFVGTDTELDDDKLLTVIGNDVWIGANANIKRGVKIGDGAIIAMNAVVTKDIPPYAIAAGVPAKILKYRFDEDTIKYLNKIKWWNISEDVLKNRINSMYDYKKFKNITKE